MLEMTGGVFCTTVTTNERVVVTLLASVTVSVIVVVPNCPATGVMVTVRLPEPMMVMFASGTSAGFDDDFVKVSSRSAVSLSPIENAIGPTVVAWLTLLATLL